jgi:hypothetical protein
LQIVERVLQLPLIAAAGAHLALLLALRTLLLTLLAALLSGLLPGLSGLSTLPGLP